MNWKPLDVYDEDSKRNPDVLYEGGIREDEDPDDYIKHNNRLRP